MPKKKRKSLVQRGEAKATQIVGYARLVQPRFDAFFGVKPKPKPKRKKKRAKKVIIIKYK